MRPLDAWRIISANMIELYKMRKTGCFKGYTEAETEAEVICFEALHQMEKRMNRGTPSRKLIMPEKHKLLIRAMADHNLNREQAGAAVGYTYSGAKYALEKIKDLTGLDPKSFHDLNKLLEMIQEDAGNGR